MAAQRCAVVSNDVYVVQQLSFCRSEHQDVVLRGRLGFVTSHTTLLLQIVVGNESLRVNKYSHAFTGLLVARPARRISEFICMGIALS